MPGLPSGWFTQVTRQGDSLKSLISPTERYFAFLSKVDAVPGSATTHYNIMFEVQTYEWTAAAILGPAVSIEARPPMTPASIFFVEGVAEAPILSALGLSSPDILAEGSWFQVSLTKGVGDVTGYFYDGEIDRDPKNYFDFGPVDAGGEPPGDHPQFFGRYNLSNAKLISLPGWDWRRGLRSDVPPPVESPSDAAIYGPIRARLGGRYRVHGKPVPIAPKPAPDEQDGAAGG